MYSTFIPPAGLSVVVPYPGTICLQGGTSLRQLTRMRASAMVSPASGMKAPAPAAMVWGKGAPLTAAPAQAEANTPARPWECGFWAVAGRWQPLQLTTSPGFTCSHTPCTGVIRRAFASSTLMRKATLPGTSMRTEPSGSMGA